MSDVERAAEELFTALHGDAHAGDPDWLTSLSSSSGPGEARATVECQSCGFTAGAAYRDPLEVSLMGVSR